MDLRSQVGLRREKMLVLTGKFREETISPGLEIRIFWRYKNPGLFGVF